MGCGCRQSRLDLGEVHLRTLQLLPERLHLHESLGARGLQHLHRLLVRKSFQEAGRLGVGRNEIPLCLLVPLQGIREGALVLIDLLLHGDALLVHLAKLRLQRLLAGLRKSLSVHGLLELVPGRLPHLHGLHELGLEVCQPILQIADIHGQLVDNRFQPGDARQEVAVDCPLLQVLAEEPRVVVDANGLPQADGLTLLLEVLQHLRGDGVLALVRVHPGHDPGEGLLDSRDPRIHSFDHPSLDLGRLADLAQGAQIDHALDRVEGRLRFALAEAVECAHSIAHDACGPEGVHILVEILVQVEALVDPDFAHRLQGLAVEEEVHLFGNRLDGHLQLLNNLVCVLGGREALLHLFQRLVRLFHQGLEGGLRVPGVLQRLLRIGDVYAGLRKNLHGIGQGRPLALDELLEIPKIGAGIQQVVLGILDSIEPLVHRVPQALNLLLQGSECLPGRRASGNGVLRCTVGLHRGRPLLDELI
mmetsp:Transcript_8962/g.20323  ORF Transcript_8962/g.20323 Transcript_8962/m.20323 type:complete len:475 (-) Transcript_8962:712-2136(-)